MKKTKRVLTVMLTFTMFLASLPTLPGKPIGGGSKPFSRDKMFYCMTSNEWFELGEFLGECPNEDCTAETYEYHCTTCGKSAVMCDNLHKH